MKNIKQGSNLKKNLLVLSLLTYFFIIIFASLIQLLKIMFFVLPLWITISWVILAVFLYFFGSYLLVKYQYLHFFVFFVLLISGACLAFLFLVQKYELLDVILLSVFAGILCGYYIAKKVFQFSSKLYTLLVLVSLLIIGGFIISSIVRKPFFWTKIQFAFLFILSYLSLKYSIKSFAFKFPLQLHLGKYFRLFLVLLPIASSVILIASVHIVEINVNNSPDLIFWSSAVETPTDEETLDYCADHDVGFCVVLRESYINDGGASERMHIEYLLNHSIETYICLGGPDGAFYLSTENGDEFLDIFKTIRSWMRTHNLYNYKCMKGFVVDAEIPKFYHTALKDYETTEKGEYFLNHLPRENKLEKIQKSLDAMIDEIHDDDKIIGIIKLPTMFDNLDGDADYDYLSNTIYSLDLPWDKSISMNYRTQHVPNIYDYMIKDMSEYDYTSDYEIEYLQRSQLERNIVPLSTFYQEVAYEIYNSDVGIEDIDDRYIFIGVFTEKFKDTSYIQENEYKRDLDVCRHFGVKQVWIYEYSGFEKFYDLKDIVKYNEAKQHYFITIPTYMINRELLLSLGVIVIDKLLYI